VVALGRRLDEGASQTSAASQDWQTLLPQGRWVHLAAAYAPAEDYPAKAS
jgi:hypothetical protein